MSKPNLLAAAGCLRLRVGEPGEVRRMKGNGSVRRAGPEQGGQVHAWSTPGPDLLVPADSVSVGTLESGRFVGVRSTALVPVPDQSRAWSWLPVPVPPPLPTCCLPFVAYATDSWIPRLVGSSDTAVLPEPDHSRPFFWLNPVLPGNVPQPTCWVPLMP